MSEERFELQKIQTTEKDALARRGYSRGILHPEPYLDEYGYGQGLEFGQGSDEDGSDLTKMLRGIGRLILAYKWLIIAVTVAVTFVVYVEAARIRPSYTAFTQIEIRRDNSVMTSPINDSDPQNMVIINTKMLMFDSRPLLESVITKNGLDKDPNFVDISLKRSRIDTIKAMFGLEKPETEPVTSVTNRPSTAAKADLENSDNTNDSVPENRKLDRFINILKIGKKVEPIINTSALKISFKHNDPEIARIVAEALTNSFIERNLYSKIEKFDASREMLERSTSQIEAQVQKAEQDLSKFTAQHGILALDEGGQDSLALTKLTRINDQMGQVQRDLMTKELAIKEIDAGLGRQLPQVVSDPRISGFQAKLDELKREQENLENDFGPEFPRVKEIKLQVAKATEQLDGGIKDLEKRIRGDYERTKKDYDELEKHLALTQSEALQKNQAAISYEVLKQKFDSAKSLYTELLQKKNQINIEAAQQKSNINVLRPAELPHSPDGVDPLSAAALGLAAAFAGSVGLAFLWDRLDTTIKSTGDVSRYAHLPTLGLIPSISSGGMKQIAAKYGEKGTRLSISEQTSNGNKAADKNVFSHRFLRASDSKGDVDGNSASDSLDSGSNRVILFDDRSPVAEAYRGLRTSVLLSGGGNPPKTMLFTSGQPEEGKTTTVINTAISLAHLGASVLIIDADLRKPSTHKGFNIKQAHGLSTYLSRDADLNELIQKLHIPNLFLLPCGPIPSNPSELISSEKMRDMLKMLAEKFDHILIDSPPLMYVTDPVILSTLVDGVVLVVHGGKSRREVVRLSRQMLDNVGARVFGAVLNNIKPDKKSYEESGYYKYYSYYGEQQRKEERVSDILKGM